MSYALSFCPLAMESPERVSPPPPPFQQPLLGLAAQHTPGSLLIPQEIPQFCFPVRADPPLHGEGCGSSPEPALTCHPGQGPPAWLGHCSLALSIHSPIFGQEPEELKV